MERAIRYIKNARLFLLTVTQNPKNSLRRRFSDLDGAVICRIDEEAYGTIRNLAVLVGGDRRHDPLRCVELGHYSWSSEFGGTLPAGYSASPPEFKGMPPHSYKLLTVC